jgi:RecA/RadA recombinase
MQTNTPGLLGINGLAGSGKTTAADMLVANGWKRVKFADPLKNMLRSFGLDDRHIEGDLKEVPCDLLEGKTPRWAMQTLGTEWGRQMIGPDIWTNAARRMMVQHMQAGFNVVCDDVRFDNEGDLIRDMGGMVLGITRQGVDAGNHESERRVKCDLWFNNEGTISELRGFMTYVFLDREGGF